MGGVKPKYYNWLQSLKGVGVKSKYYSLTIFEEKYRVGIVTFSFKKSAFKYCFWSNEQKNPKIGQFDPKS